MSRSEILLLSGIIFKIVVEQSRFASQEEAVEACLLCVSIRVVVFLHFVDITLFHPISGRGPCFFDLKFVHPIVVFPTPA